MVLAAIALLAEDGVTGVTLRALARRSGISTGSLLHHFGSREHGLRVAAKRTARWRREEISRRAGREGVLAFLPTAGADQDEDLHVERAWLSWCELARTSDWLAESVAQAHAEERALLASTLDYELDRTGLDGVTALVHGLLVGLTLPESRLAIGTARALLSAYVAQLLAASAAARSSATMRSGSEAE